MDTERSGEVSDVSETPQQEEAVMEKEVVSKLTTPEEFTEPENPPAAEEDHDQPAVNGHSTEEMKSQETDELIVTESETMSEDKAEMEIEEPGVVTRADDSSENNSDPVGALDTEPEKIPPVPENIPEPLPVQTPLAEIAAVPAPDELPKSVPEAEPPAQMLHEPVEPPQLVDKQPLDREEEVSEEVEAEAESKPTMDTGAEAAAQEAARETGDAAKEDTVNADGSSEKPTEAVTLKEEKAVESGNVKVVEDEKEAEKAADSDTVAAAEPVAEGAKSEPEKETVPETGSLSFALLEQEQTRNALRTSRTLVVLRGLPGSGKSFLARAIADAYKDQCTVISADDYGIKPESPESCADGYKALDEAVVACCTASSATALIVVDDTNHTQDRLARMGEVANEHHLVVIFLEPRTEWSRDVAQLSKKTRRGLEEAQMKTMHGQLEEMSFPLFFGWFLLSSVQEKVRCTAMDFLKTLDTLEAFKKHSAEFTGKADKDVDLEQYFQAKGALHCTTKFCNYGKAEGAKEYVQKQAVKDFYGSTFELSLSALFVTPRTVGARVSLTTEQLLLWPADAEKEAEAVVPAAASLPLGSRAHVTLGCAEGVEPVQTGLDLLGILALQQGGQQGELVEEMELGTLTYYGEGRWLLSLREPICAPACFSSFYGGKEPETTKKEPEKKKKPKCAIL